jgi:hypothetical protein
LENERRLVACPLLLPSAPLPHYSPPPSLSALGPLDTLLDTLDTLDTFDTSSPLHSLSHLSLDSRATGTTRMSLVFLPLEILQQIAACIETVHRPSLLTFSLINQACYRASVFLIFRQISILVRNPEGLRRDVDRLTEALSRMDSARHVQCIRIKGDIRSNVIKDNRHAEWLRGTGLDEILVDWDPISYHRRYVTYDEPVIKKESEEDVAWTPIVNLVQAIPYLKDLIYDCESQFPPILLSTLHKQHPHCRLHHLSFRFRTLLWGVPYPYEMELATSPLLYKVKITSTGQDSEYDDNFNEEALMELAAGLAPNLKEVDVVDIISIRSNRYHRRRGPWQGLPGFTGTVGSLQSLSMKGFANLRSPDLLQNWAKHTDFACLQNLELGGGYENTSNALSSDTMEWVAQNLSFPQLRKLSVYVGRDDMMEERPHYSRNAVSFFQNLESLEELAVHGPIDSQIFKTLLRHHGQTLKKLKLRPFEDPYHIDNGRDRRDIAMEFTKDDFLQIQAHCPVLEDLAITVKRNQSSASETEIYKCFGKMRSLRYLFLTLDCSNMRITRDSTYDPQFDGDDNRFLDDGTANSVKKGVFKETLINCAVDEALARSIWKTVVQNKAGRKLEHLRLWTTGGFKYSTRWGVQASTIVAVLSRSWLLERVPRDDQDDITVRELGKCGREVGMGIYASDVQAFSKSAAGQVFNSIWPRKQGSKDWRDDWSSSPLQN